MPVVACWLLGQAPARAYGQDVRPTLERLRQLEVHLDRYPPDLGGDRQRRAIVASYQELKTQLDAQVSATPTDPVPRYWRGRLQRFGHNLDLPGAWLGSTHDLRTVLAMDPSHVPALLDLGTLWVHSWPALAPNAESLLRTAQCHHGAQPLEVAQRGVFFALYFQGKVREAVQQIDYMQQVWPEHDEYTRLGEMAHADLGRIGTGLHQVGPVSVRSGPATMANCDNR